MLSSEERIVKKAYSASVFTTKQVRELAKCYNDPIYFMETFVYIQHPIKGRQLLKLYQFQREMVEAIHGNRYSILLTARQMGKALSVDTPIMTPAGFVKLDNLSIGDTIFSPTGEQVKISFITETMVNHTCYEIEFSHGEKIIADEEHLWEIELPSRRDSTRVVTTKELLKWFNHYKDTTQSIHIKHTKPLHFNEQKLDLHPYVLGLWMGDGGKTDTRITCTQEDYLVYKKKLTALGYRISDFRLDRRSERTGNFVVYELVTALKKLGVWGNRYIPEQYIFNSIENRIQLLQGLLDSDGTIEKNGCSNFYQSDENLCKQVRLVLSTLGVKSTLSVRETTHKDNWSVRFSSNDFAFFHLPRKSCRLENLKNHPKNKRIYIKSINKTDSVPVKCLQVDNKDHLFLCGETLIPTHNTTVASAYLLWYAMFKDDATILIVANNNAQALEIMQRIRFAYEEIPDYIRAGGVSYNKGSIEFDNGSRIISRATTANSGRGLSITLLYADEFAFVQPNMAQEFWTAIQPTLSTGGGCILTSTPNGDDDIFAQTWRGACDNIGHNGMPIAGGIGKNGFRAFQAIWDRHPDRDEEWAETQRRQVGIDKFKREFECEFLSAEETLINSIVLQRLEGKEPQWADGLVRWFERPLPNRAYLVGLDPSTGTGGDRAAIQVYMLPEMRQICEWCDNMSPPKVQLETLHKILNFIKDELSSDITQKENPDNSIYWTFENNGVGESIASLITEVGEERFPGTFMHEPKRAGLRRGRKGLTTSNKPKVSACTKLKSLIESDRIELCSKALVSELKNYIRKGHGFEAKQGHSDDLVAASLLAVRLAEIVRDFDPKITEKLREVIESEGDEHEPLPFIMSVGF